jgi:hypothetical protein
LGAVQLSLLGEEIKETSVRKILARPRPAAKNCLEIPPSNNQEMTSTVVPKEDSGQIFLESLADMLLSQTGNRAYVKEKTFVEKQQISDLLIRASQKIGGLPEKLAEEAAKILRERTNLYVCQAIAAAINMDVLDLFNYQKSVKKILIRRK